MYFLICHISPDMGKSRSETCKIPCAKRICNPQVAKVKGGFILHGRSGCESAELPYNFVLYTSPDGIQWDEREYLLEESGKWAYYSNNSVAGDKVLSQTSVPREEGRTDVRHLWLKIR